MLVYTMLGIILVVFGAFIGFTYLRTTIDYDKKQIKSCNILFGLFSIGKWIEIEPDMKVGLKKDRMVWRTYSMSNRSVDIEKSDIYLVLFGSDKKSILTINRLKTLDEAKEELKKICKRLKLTPFQ